MQLAMPQLIKALIPEMQAMVPKTAPVPRLGMLKQPMTVNTRFNVLVAAHAKEAIRFVRLVGSRVTPSPTFASDVIELGVGGGIMHE